LAVRREVHRTVQIKAEKRRGIIITLKPYTRGIPLSPMVGADVPAAGWVFPRTPDLAGAAMVNPSLYAGMSP